MTPAEAKLFLDLGRAANEYALAACAELDLFVRADVAAKFTAGHAIEVRVRQWTEGCVPAFSVVLVDATGEERVLRRDGGPA